MSAAPRPRDRVAAELARVLVGWLVVILLVQGQAALQTLVRGPAHRHVAALLAEERGPPSFSHRVADVDEVRRAWHRSAHERGDAHHHANDELALPAEAEAALDTAACALMAALVPLVVHYGWPACAARARPVAGAAWALRETDPAPPRRPPRR